MNKGTIILVLALCVGLMPFFLSDYGDKVIFQVTQWHFFLAVASILSCIGWTLVKKNKVANYNASSLNSIVCFLIGVYLIVTWVIDQKNLFVLVSGIIITLLSVFNYPKPINQD